MPGGMGGGQAGTAISSLESLLRAAEKDDLLLYLTAFCGVVMPGCVYVLYHYMHKMYMEHSKKREEERLQEERMRSAVTIFFASEGNEAEHLAYLVADRLSHESPPLIDLCNVDIEDFSHYKGIGLFVVSSAKKGREPEMVEWFYDWLEDLGAEKKFRKCKEHACRKMHFAVLGIDSSLNGLDRFNRAAKTLARRLRAIGAKPLYSLAFADRNQIASLEEQADAWADRILEALDGFTVPEESSSMNFFGMRRQSSTESVSSDSDFELSSYRRNLLSLRHIMNRRNRFADNDEEQSDLSEEESLNRQTSQQWANIRQFRSGANIRNRGKEDNHFS